MTPALPPEGTSEGREQCPGQFAHWSAWGATYSDTFCASALTWPVGEFPGHVLCDADDDLRPRGEIPCPACDPNGFNEWAGDPTAAERVMAREVTR